ncbi:DUF6268 family outer membrane beta-barrel protein [Aquimarina gracilis]|uniref:DUF6268 family outer membrane beta-barrel protein n=1 Tax=Aquimarina gracilis TaxID=874422 RepID=A0ABU5ZX06_9FLAO|nr:DUF6268 family outer membrane beta-barrel protein [Aquimarina gracilis]MEB3346380.1 DUF6268 family outer membrane beta-barrel protein [Aquimarina gracilis]
MKYSYYLLIALAFCIQPLVAQDYVDILKINYANILNAGFEDSDAETNVGLLDLSLTYPIKLSEKTAIITGIDYNQQDLDLFPNAESVSLKNITLKAGLNIKHNDKWSGTYVFLPKIASQDLHTDGDHLFFGGLALLKYQKSERMQYRFGAYVSTEGFGTFMTPILGMYYTSEDNTWEFTATLPINADLNYSFNDAISAGLGFQAFVRSYSLERAESLPELYTQVANIEFAPYFQHGFADNSILVRLQAGYSTASYEVYEEGDTLPIRVSAFEFGNDRNLINPEMTGNLFVRVGATYRFNLTGK